MLTIQDVAKAAGVSVATVSRVLNNSSNVSESTRENVLKVMQELNYQPNLLGRHLRRCETRMILVIVHSIINTFYAKVAKGIEDIAHQNGYNIMICNTYSEKERELAYLELLKNKLMDGAILLNTQLNKDELNELGGNCAIVQCCEYKLGSNVPYVSIDNKAAAAEMVKHLINFGHKKIGMISVENDYMSTNQREEGYKQALKEAGIEFDSNLIKYGNYGFRSAQIVTSMFLDMKERPTAIFAISDIMAIGAIKQIKNSGLNVPEHMAVAGFDNISFSYMCEPAITTVSQNQYELGSKAMNILLKRIKGEQEDVTNIMVDFEIIIRESTIK